MDCDDFHTFVSFAEVQNFFTGFKGNTFRITHVNIRSIRKYWDHFLALISPFCSCFDAFVLTEINISSDSFTKYKIPGYQVFSYTRPMGRGGGVAVFIKNIWSVTEIKFSFQQAEVVTLHL